MTAPLEILQHYWGHTAFRAPQEAIISAVLQKKDVVALLPTGGGKSACFQIPALAQEGICLVISPLLALMQDQVNHLTDKGIKAATIPNGSTQDDLITLFDTLRFGKYKFLYISPERLASPFMQEKIQQLPVNLIAIDEAHCISEWGHDFRPSYRNIKILRTLQPTSPIIALTASATEKVLQDILMNLEMEAPKVFKKSFFRPNLAYQIFEVENKLQRLVQIFTKTKKPAIVYVNTRNRSKEIAAFLNAQGFTSGYYHGGLSYVEKQAAFTRWTTEETPIIVATNAFGMGIDKANIGVVVHVDLPVSIENYLQEAGRAGRDGEKAFSVVLQNKGDRSLFLDLLEKRTPSLAEIKTIHKNLYQHFQIALGELLETTFDFNLLHFCEKYQISTSKTQQALHILHNHGIVRFLQNSQQKSTVEFLVSSAAVLNYSKQHPGQKKMINSLLRTYGGLFEQPTKIDEFYLAKKAQTTSWNTIQFLENLATQNIIDYQKANDHALLTFLLPREDDKSVHRVSKNVLAFLTQKRRKATELLHFLETNNRCRSVQLLHYFNEKKPTPCGICDVCLHQKNNRIVALSEEILACLHGSKKTSIEICQLISAKEQDILINLQVLLASEQIAVNNTNQYHLI